MAAKCGLSAQLRVSLRGCSRPYSRHATKCLSRAASTSMPDPDKPGPKPGPPKPNSPFTIFDRRAKAKQKDRAATLRSENSRLTDYVRMAAAENLAERLLDIKRSFPTIIELGAGPGYLRHHLDAKGTGTEEIIMCDTSEGALHRDAHLDQDFPFRTTRRIVDEEQLPFEENSLDCIVSCGALHWTNDLPGALVQIQRALKPDGVFLGALYGGDTLFELRTALQLAEQERHGGISPRISPMTDTRDMSSLLGRANFALPTVDIDEISVNYPTMYELVEDLRDMGESNAVINRRAHISRDALLASSAIYQAMHGNDDGSIPATFAIIYVIGWKPAPSQPKPLQRGSGSTNLKDILGDGIEDERPK